MDLTIPINKVPTKFIAYECDIGGDLKETKFLILVIPGNPGIIEFYREFMKQISVDMKIEFPKQTIPVWGISHAGHETDGINSHYLNLDDYPELYSLEGQINHKMSFVKMYIPQHVKVVLIGHSIGCHIILQLLKRDAQFSSQVIKVHMLFPTIERMRETPNGKFFTSVECLHWVPMVMSWPIGILPYDFRYFLAKIYLFFRPNVPKCIYKGISSLVQKSIVEKSINMAMCEMDQVYELDVTTLEENLNRLWFYFGLTDSWCPMDYVENLKTLLPNLKYVICSKGIEHAFVISDSNTMASIIVPECVDVFKMLEQ